MATSKNSASDLDSSHITSPGGELAAGELERELQRVGEQVAEVLERADLLAAAEALAQPLSTVHHAALRLSAHMSTSKVKDTS